VIVRDMQQASQQRYDLAVIGGGIHGACTALEAARRGLQVLLLEAADFGVGASGNSLRILHGGLRYLQRADLVRFRESVAERRWYARTFPGLVSPLSCLMPLYGQGLKRAAVLRIALSINDWLSRDRNERLEECVGLGDGRILDPVATRARFASVRAPGLEGAALWYDYHMRSSERILMEILLWAGRLGARTLNYAQVTGLQRYAGRGLGLGLVVEDRLNSGRVEFRADRICNCTGSSAREFSALHDREHPRLFVPSLAFNVLFDCNRLSDDALAVAAPEPKAPVYFLCPSPYGLWAGTEHAGRPDRWMEPVVAESELLDFIGRINRAIPSLSLSLANVRRVFAGLLPVHAVNSTNLTGREVVIDHGARGGVRGLYSLTGIKFTTARKAAARAVDVMLQSRRGTVLPEEAPPLSVATDWLTDGARVQEWPRADALRRIRELAVQESALTAQDLCLRRTNWIFTAPDYRALEKLTAEALVSLPAPRMAGHAAPGLA
jgi:glycerol-3-phosphate dehydrogenase